MTSKKPDRMADFSSERWVERLPIEETSLYLLVPLGTARVVVPHGGELVCLSRGSVQTLHPGKAYLIGLFDKPVLLKAVRPNTTSSWLELPALKLLSYFPSLADSTKIFRELELRELPECHSAEVPEFFARAFHEILEAKGLISISELAARVGYTPRWTRDRFRKVLGIGVKALAGLIRFRYFYLNSAENGFYDQSHRSKSFKRYRGLPPGRVASSDFVVSISTSDLYYMIYDRNVDFGYNTLIQLLGRGYL